MVKLFKLLTLSLLLAGVMTSAVWFSYSNTYSGGSGYGGGFNKHIQHQVLTDADFLREVVINPGGIGVEYTDYYTSGEYKHGSSSPTPDVQQTVIIEVD